MKHLRKLSALFALLAICFGLAAAATAQTDFGIRDVEEWITEQTGTETDEENTEIEARLSAKLRKKAEYLAAETAEEVVCPYGDADLNRIASVVNGEVGGICGTVVLTYADGSQIRTDGCTLHKIHARIVHNQVRSSLFPSTVSGCVRQCWSTAYDRPDWRSSSQWQHCRVDAVDALTGGISVPDNVFAATCDSRFASYYPGWRLWARVDWNTGWYSGTFYYYSYG